MSRTREPPVSKVIGDRGFLFSMYWNKRFLIGIIITDRTWQVPGTSSGTQTADCVEGLSEEYGEGIGLSEQKKEDI